MPLFDVVSSVLLGANRQLNQNYNNLPMNPGNEPLSEAVAVTRRKQHPVFHMTSSSPPPGIHDNHHHSSQHRDQHHLASSSPHHRSPYHRHSSASAKSPAVPSAHHLSPSHSTNSPPRQQHEPAARNPLAGKPFFVNPHSQAAVACSQLKLSKPHSAETEATCYIASVATADQELGYWTLENAMKSGGGIAAAKQSVIDRVNNLFALRDQHQPGSTVMLEAHFRNTFAHSGSCAASASSAPVSMAAYDALYEALNVPGRNALLVLEYDILGSPCLDQNIKVLEYGIRKLSSLPNVAIYVDATAPDWVEPSKIAARLAAAGVEKVRGFALNMSHQDWTGLNVLYGTQINEYLRHNHGFTHDTPFIINTGINGRGDLRYHHPHGTITTYNCNAPLRGLGIPSTTNTLPYVSKLPHSYTGGKNLVDAFIWFTNPGQSDGRNVNCVWKPYTYATTANMGAWFQAYANDLYKYRTKWLLPPNGYVNGWPAHPPPYRWPTKYTDTNVHG